MTIAEMDPDKANADMIMTNPLVEVNLENTMDMDHDIAPNNAVMNFDPEKTVMEMDPYKVAVEMAPNNAVLEIILEETVLEVDLDIAAMVRCLEEVAVEIDLEEAATKEWFLMKLGLVEVQTKKIGK